MTVITWKSPVHCQHVYPGAGMSLDDPGSRRKLFRTLYHAYVYIRASYFGDMETAADTFRYPPPDRLPMNYDRDAWESVRESVLAFLLHKTFREYPTVALAFHELLQTAITRDGDIMRITKFRVQAGMNELITPAGGQTLYGSVLNTFATGLISAIPAIASLRPPVHEIRDVDQTLAKNENIALIIPESTWERLTIRQQHMKRVIVLDNMDTLQQSRRRESFYDALYIFVKETRGSDFTIFADVGKCWSTGDAETIFRILIAAPNIYPAVLI